MMGTGSRESTCIFQLEIFAKPSLTWAEQLQQDCTVWFRFLLLQPRFACSESWTLCWVRALVHLHLPSSVLNSLWRGKGFVLVGAGVWLPRLSLFILNLSLVHLSGRDKLMFAKVAREIIWKAPSEVGCLHWWLDETKEQMSKRKAFKVFSACGAWLRAVLQGSLPLPQGLPESV